MWKPFDSQYKIYPCPFCGYRGLLYRIGSGYVIRCENLACHAEQNVYSTEEAAVYKWNKRIHFEPKMESEERNDCEFSYEDEDIHWGRPEDWWNTEYEGNEEMGMTIEDAIKHGQEQLEVFGGEHKEFIECAIYTMRKYQKIEDIYYHQTGKALEDSLRSVIEDGNE